MTFSVNVMVLLYILHRRIGKFGGRRIVLSAVRSLACATAMAVVLMWLLAEMTGKVQTVVPGLMSIGPLVRPACICRFAPTA